MSSPVNSTLNPPHVSRKLRWAIPVSIVGGSAMTLLPFVASFPVLPPFGLMMLMAWRLLKPERFRPWSPLAYGFFDDLISGQPMGSAMYCWTICFLVADMIDHRLVYRDFLLDWMIAGGAIAFSLIFGRLVATPLGTHVDTLLLLQIVVSILLFPLVFSLCVRLDRRGVRR